MIVFLWSGMVSRPIAVDEELWKKNISIYILEDRIDGILLLLLKKKAKQMQMRKMGKV